MIILTSPDPTCMQCVTEDLFLLRLLQHHAATTLWDKSRCSSALREHTLSDRAVNPRPRDPAAATMQYDDRGNSSPWIGARRKDDRPSWGERNGVNAKVSTNGKKPAFRAGTEPQAIRFLVMKHTYDVTQCIMCD